MQQIQEYSYMTKLLMQSAEFQRWPKEKQRKAIEELEKGQEKINKDKELSSFRDKLRKSMGESCGIFSIVSFI